MAKFGGAQINAGRKSSLDEHLRSQVIKKCWSVVQEALNGQSKKYKLSAKEELALAMEVVKRSVPQEITFSEDYESSEALGQRIAELTESISRLRVGTPATEAQKD